MPIVGDSFYGGWSGDFDNADDDGDVGDDEQSGSSAEVSAKAAVNGSGSGKSTTAVDATFLASFSATPEAATAAATLPLHLLSFRVTLPHPATKATVRVVTPAALRPAWLPPDVAAKLADL
jgi:hypothetical protein